MQIISFICAIFTYFLHFNLGWFNPYSMSLGDECLGHALNGINIFQVIFLFAAIIVTLIAVWKVQDPYYVKLELKLSLGIGIVVFIVWMALLFVVSNGKPSFALYAGFYALIIVTLLLPFFLTFQSKHTRLNRESSIYSIESRESFEMIFGDDENFKSFQEFFFSLSFFLFSFLSFLLFSMKFQIDFVFRNGVLKDFIFIEKF